MNIMKIIHEDKVLNCKNVICKSANCEIWSCEMTHNDSEKNSILRLIKLTENHQQILAQAKLLQELASSPDLHSILPQIHTFFIHEQSLAIVYEHLNDSLLTDTFKEGTVANYYDFMRLAKSLAKAIGYLHLSGLTHGNLKLNNISYCPDTGHVKLLDLDLSSTLLPGLAINFSPTDYTPLDVLEMDSIISFTQRAKHDIWSYHQCMFRIANGFDMIAGKSTGALIKALHGKNYRNSRHPNEKINEFLNFMLQENFSDRPGIFDIQAYLETYQTSSILDITRYSDNGTIVQRVARNTGLSLNETDGLEQVNDAIIIKLHEQSPLMAKNYSNEYIVMLAEFFGLQNVSSYPFSLLIENINNRVTIASEIISLRNAFRIVKMIIKVADFSVADSREYRRKILEMYVGLLQEKLISGANLQTAWAVESDKLHGQAKTLEQATIYVSTFLKK